MKKIFKIVFIALIGIVTLFLIYSLIPRVIHFKGQFGKELPNSDILPKKVKKDIQTFVRDTASKMQTVMAIQNGKVIFEEGDTKKLINCHSARKSIMSLLIWINKSLRDFTVLSNDIAKMNVPYDAFAYSWWIDNDNKTVWADGYGGQFLCIDRTNNLVVL